MCICFFYMESPTGWVCPCLAKTIDDNFRMKQITARISNLPFCFFRISVLEIYCYNEFCLYLHYKCFKIDFQVWRCLRFTSRRYTDPPTDVVYVRSKPAGQFHICLIIFTLRFIYGSKNNRPKKISMFTQWSHYIHVDFTAHALYM